MKPGSTNANIFLAAIVGCLVLLNVLGLRTFGRFDATRDEIYTLAQSSRETMEKLEDPVTVTAYFTDDLPPPYSSNARYVRDLLEEFRAASRGRLSFEFLDPMTQETAEDQEAKKEMKRDIFGRVFREPTSVERELAQEGVQPVEIRVIEDDQMQTKRAYMGIVIKHQEKKEVIPVVQDVRTLEYDLTTLVRKLTRPKTPVLGVVQGHDAPSLREKLTAVQTLLSQQYEVRPVDLSGKERVDADVDALLVVGPKTAFQPAEVKAIDQFVMEGKSVAFFLDSVQVDLKTFEPSEATHGLGPLLAAWGIQVGDRLVADVESAQLNIQERRGFMLVSMPVPYPFIPMLERLEGDSPVTRGLSGVSLPFSTAVTATAPEGAQATVLAKSSRKSWLEGKPYNIDPRRDWRSETVTPDGPHPLMVQVSGKLKSHFAAEAQASTASGTPVLAESKGESRVIVAGGSAALWDDFMGRPNQALLLNVADWLLLDPALLEMRTRGMAEAPLRQELSATARNAAKFGNAFGIPFALVAFGLVRWRMREARRATVTV
ncbi:GldG family protein [Myxococcus sp. RHSTA-1-4]|uniref:GldG family protein n=1 Tax=Myxococcus sp. RHSTA-1-4 TaxID=2874601 RepID=UPI001CBD1E59|nr:GldG family protein [Myxococcus sp. RHSTA-1-4]MBZ4418466.1 GldG family protein [Myxococcus sp. RHSTA-1-4]